MAIASDIASEDRRLAALYDLSILDSPAEAAFDDVVEIVAALCDVPIALISLVDRDRQWFKASVGLDRQETPLNDSVSALAIRQRGVLVIEDLAADPRTAGNSLVSAPGGPRFYAGAPILTDDGEAVGSLCAIDTRPRPGGLTPRQSRALQALARQVMTALRVRRDTLVEMSERVLSAQEAGRIGTFEVDIASNMTAVSPELCRLFGLPIRPAYPPQVFEACVIGESDRDGMPSTSTSRADASAPVDVEYQIRRADDGRVRWLSRRGAFEFDAEGRPVRMRGAIHDVTDRRVATERIEALLRLGDALRERETVEDIADAAAQTLCAVLHASRCGYASIDMREGTFTVDRDCVTEGVPSIVGIYPIATFAATIDELRLGRICAYTDVEQVPLIADDVKGFHGVGGRALIAVPLMERGELRGILFAQDYSPRIWDEQEVSFVQGVADRTYAAIAKARAEDNRTLLNHELSHRLKNSLSMIQAIAVQTLKAVPDRGPVEAFTRRLMALSAAHDVLLQEKWAAARIDMVVEGVFDKLGLRDRVRTNGPATLVGARAVLGISLLIHELATNAIKYGALSVPEGRVVVNWSVQIDLEEPQFTLSWRERDGPPASQPTGRGFGSRLISMGLVGTGGSEVRYLPSGLEADFVASLARVKTD